MITPNTIVGGRYRVIKALGGGGMKLVYLAEDLRLAARRCALAEMVDSFTSPDAQLQAVAAFQREADMLAQLSNEHIPRVFDRFSESNHHYLVMEYIDGSTLEDQLRSNNGKLPPERVIDVAIQILDTLDYLHNLLPPVIYRDLKPSNVMVTDDGQAKLIDFGIARHFQPLTNATMIGTQGYAPPEQYRGKVETRSDLYALGATMHHAISGRDPSAEPPFSFPPLHKLCPDIDPGLAAVIDQTLAYDVVNRIRDAAEFKHRLIAIRSGSLKTADAAAVGARAATLSSPSNNKAKPQLNLPLAGTHSAGAGQAPSAGRQRLGSTPPNPSAAQAHSAPTGPTILSIGGEIRCPRCARTIPADSHFCSYCAVNLSAALNTSTSAAHPNDETVVLSAPHAPQAPYNSDAGQSRVSRPRIIGYLPRQRGGLRRPLLILALIFLGGFIIMKLIEPPNSDNTAPSGYSTGSSDSGEIAPPGVRSEIPPAPEAPGSGGSLEPGTDSTRLAALRQALNDHGYSAVHFRMDGDTIILWGKVPSELDRATVQMLCATAGIYSLRDRLTVDEADSF
jgi:serine/threonine protein kinase